MFHKLLLVLFLFAYSINGYTKTLCIASEKIIFAFNIKKTEKIMSICKSKDEKYLVYRYGSPLKVELEYPSTLDESSWKKFTFSGYRRVGGRENAGMGDYSLSFSIGKYDYTVFQQWSYEDDSFDIGINVSNNRQSKILVGNLKTQEGSLVLLDMESKRLPNTEN